MKDYAFHLVRSIDQLKKLVDMCIEKKLWSLDLETTGLDNRVYPDGHFKDGRKTKYGIRTIDTIAGLCISFDGKHGYYIPVGHHVEDAGNLPWDETFDEIKRLIESGGVTIFHNSKFDCEFLYPVTGKEVWKTSEYEDTYFISKVISPLKIHPSGLKQLTKKYFDVDMIELEELYSPEMMKMLRQEGEGYNFAVLHPKEGLEYGCSDGIFTYKLFEVMIKELSEQDIVIAKLEKSFCNVVRKLERNRVHIDREKVESLYTLCNVEMEKISGLIRSELEEKTRGTGEWLTLSMGSNKELSHAFFTSEHGLRLKPTKLILQMMEEKNGGGSYGSYSSFGDDEDDEEESDSGPGNGKTIQYTLKDEALKSLDQAYGQKFMIDAGHKDKEGNPIKESIFALLIEWRHYQKMDGSFIGIFRRALDEYGDVRPNFRQLGTDTTRLSSPAGKIEDGYSGLNFQGIPRDSDEDKPELFKKIRECIIPRKGKILVKLDFAGEELRVVTNLSGDPIWTKSFLYEDGDVHSITARALFEKEEVNKDERNRGKRSNFAFLYGGGAGAIQRNINCSMEDAQRGMDNLKKAVPVIMGYIEQQKEFARQNKCIITAYGRRIPIANIDHQIKKLRSKAERCAINYTIQGTSADILKFAMCYVDKKIREHGWEEKCKYILTVHDEVVYEIDPDILMEAVRKLDEWMTFPWKLPKAHGRAWEVPLLTEPGIDINWKARYDYFKMVDGTPVEKSKVNEKGEYSGKLKKDEYFSHGRVYQKVPDFLVEWIHPIYKEDKPAVNSEPASSMPVASSVPATDDVEGVALSEPPITKPSLSEVERSVASIDVKVEPKEEAPKSKPVYINMDENGKFEKVDAEKEKVKKWTIRCNLTERNLKKFNALCTLCEGNDKIRVLLTDGRTLVHEDKGVSVDFEKFKVIGELFGLG